MRERMLVHPAHSFRQEMVRMNEMAEQVNEMLARYTTFGYDLVVDEVALYMPTDVRMALLATLVAHGGIEYFNNATDKVETEPFGTEYNVEYHFFRTPYPWRIELMKETGGCSPLHTAYERRGPELAVVHFSFKVATERDYDEIVAYLGDKTLAIPAQWCRSSYGAFSYWSAPVLGKDMVYLKPRVNLRDGGGLGDMHDPPAYPAQALHWDLISGDNGEGS